jgi:hypothetical protein
MYKSEYRLRSLIIIALFLFAACSKKTETNGLNDDDNGGYASDISRINWVNSDVISLADAAGFVYNGAYMRTTTIGCATVGVDTTSTMRQLTIRFGDKDCVALDGRARRGTIIIKYPGRYTDSGTVHTITFDKYYINGNNLTGTIKLVRVDSTFNGNWYYKAEINDSLNMSPDPLKSQYVVWKGNVVSKWLQGYTVYGSGDRSDDIFSISGSAMLTRQNGHAFSCGISAPMQVALNCDYVQSGVVNVSSYNGQRIVDYGTGGCDAAAKLRIETATYDLRLTK